MVRPCTAHVGGPSSRLATADGPRSFEAPRALSARGPILPDGGLRLAVPAGREAGRETAVDLWWADTGDKGDVAEAIDTLDERERARADRFLFEGDRVRYIRRHALVRGILASYLGTKPMYVVISVSAGGRPELAGRTDISFNVSASGDMAVMAVARGRRVGVDIERIRELDDAMAIAEGLFTESEVDHLRAVPAAMRSRAFLELWTRKEALVKALGGGLSIPLDRYDVTDHFTDGAWRPRGPEGPLGLTIVQLDRPSGYVGAVAVRGVAA